MSWAGAAVVQEASTASSPEALVEGLAGQPGVVLLRTGLFELPQARYSLVAARPFLVVRSFGSRCGQYIPNPRGDGSRRREAELNTSARRAPRAAATSAFGGGFQSFGDPWRLLAALMARYEMLDEPDLPFPLGGCFGYCGYDLKNFVEPRLPRRAVNDLELPDCCFGFYASLVVFDHRLDKTWIVATGLEPAGSRSYDRARAQVEFWQRCLEGEPPGESKAQPGHGPGKTEGFWRSGEAPSTGPVTSNLSRAAFLARVERALGYIRAGDIYQVNLSHRLTAPYAGSGWDLFRRLTEVSPAPLSAYLDCGDFQIVSSSPELFLRMSGRQIQTRPIKGTRPRASEPTRDAQMAYELQTSPKEMAELVMITDLLRNDLGRVCEFGSVQVPELVRLEHYPQVHHLVSTVEGHLRREVTHWEALAGCFPGGSVTGAPKVRAMEIIDELEPVSRGPYTGALGYLGFNRESQLSIIIRAAVCRQSRAFFHTGSGIVADSNPAAEYEETLTKAAGFLQALGVQVPAASVPVSFGG